MVGPTPSDQLARALFRGKAPLERGALGSSLASCVCVHTCACMCVCRNIGGAKRGVLASSLATCVYTKAHSPRTHLAQWTEGGVCELFTSSLHSQTRQVLVCFACMRKTCFQKEFTHTLQCSRAGTCIGVGAQTM